MMATRRKDKETSEKDARQLVNFITQFDGSPVDWCRLNKAEALWTRIDR
jgi:hypothetical protein